MIDIIKINLEYRSSTIKNRSHHLSPLLNGYFTAYTFKAFNDSQERNENKPRTFYAVIFYYLMNRHSEVWKREEV